MRESVCPCCSGSGRVDRATLFPREWGGVEKDWSLATLFTLDPRLEGKIEADTETGCWIWTGAAQKSGSKSNAIYGRLSRKGVLWLVHRYVYTLMVGSIPDGHHVHHRVEIGCTDTLCCNPRHLDDIEKIAHEWLHREMEGYEDCGDVAAA